MINGLKSLCVAAVVSGEPGERSCALRYAISLASAAGAGLTAHVAAVKMVLPSASSSHTVSGLVAAENKRLATIAQTQADDIRRDAEAAGVSCAAVASHSVFTDLAAGIARQSRVHDLTIFDACDSALDATRGLLDAGLFEGGRAVLVVPPGLETFTCRHALIAWDGSAMASRAVAAALPLLRSAEEVEILSITGEKDLARMTPGVDLATHLARHGVGTNVKDMPATNRSAADVLRDQIALTRADLLVMGAFKHSRLRQWVLGGVTQSMLEDCAAPLLMSH